MHVGSVTVSYILVKNSYRPRVFLSMFCKTVIKHYIHLLSRIGQHISKHYQKTARQYSFKETRSVTMNIFRKKKNLFKSFVKIELRKLCFHNKYVHYS